MGTSAGKGFRGRSNPFGSAKSKKNIGRYFYFDLSHDYIWGELFLLCTVMAGRQNRPNQDDEYSDQVPPAIWRETSDKEVER